MAEKHYTTHIEGLGTVTIRRLTKHRVRKAWNHELPLDRAGALLEAGLVAPELTDDLIDRLGQDWELLTRLSRAIMEHSDHADAFHQAEELDEWP